MKEKQVNHYTVLVLLHPQYLLRREPFFERKMFVKPRGQNGRKVAPRLDFRFLFFHVFSPIYSPCAFAIWPLPSSGRFAFGFPIFSFFRLGLFPVLTSPT